MVALLAAHPALAQNFSVDDVTINEGAAPGTTIFTFTITRDVTAGAASVDFATGDVTAIAGVDYVAVLTTTVNFADTVGSMPAQVTVNGDATVELNETFNVLLSNPQGTGVPGIADGLGVGTITNDDAATLGRLAGFNLTEGNAGTTTATFTVTMSAPVDADVTVDIATEDLVATAADGDYVATTGTVTFPAGTTANQTFGVPVNGDVKVEFDQRFQTRISNVQAQGRNVSIFDAVQTARIQNDDLGRIAIDDVTAAEGTGVGTTSFTFNVVLMDAVEIPSGQTLSVDVATADDTATTADGDYVAAGPSTRTFAGTQGETQTFVVQVNHDAKVELNEALLANLSNLVLPPPQLGLPLNVILLDSQGTGTITNDDTATLSIADVSAPETNTGSNPTFTFTVTLSAQVDVPVSVDFATANGTATIVDGDYAASSGTLNFAGTAGETETALVTVNGDAKVELDEVFFVNLSNLQAGARNVTFPDNQGIGTIANDETATLSVTDVTLLEGAAPGTTPFNFTITLDKTLANPLSVDIDAADDTATIADADFAATSATLNFAGVQNETVPFSVNVNGDNKAELNEVFHVVLSNLQASGLDVNIADQGVGTINNDDTDIDLSITKDDGGGSSFPGGPINYQLNYDNLGTDDAGGVVITETVPNDTTFNPVVSDPGWTCAPNGNAGSTCTLNVGTVSAGGSGSATFGLTVDDLGSLSGPLPLTITNTASISDETAGASDTNLANNSDMDSTPVVESAPTDFFTIDPCRVIDTRGPDGPLSGPALTAGIERIFPVAGTCGIPATAKAISVNIAVTAASAGGNVRMYPGGTSTPTISSLNYLAGQTRSNNAIVSLSDTGTLAVLATQSAGGTVHFILDVNGYFE